MAEPGPGKDSDKRNVCGQAVSNSYPGLPCLRLKERRRIKTTAWYDRGDVALSKLSVLLGFALLVAISASFGWDSMPIEERLVRIQAGATLSEIEGIESEPVEVQAVLLEYTDDKVLLLKARAALLKYPEFAREIFPLYGTEPEFRSILLAHGESILPPIHYFLHNEIRSVAWMHYAGQRFQEAKASAMNYWGSDDREPNDAAAPGKRQQAESEALTPEQRGWYAVNFIRQEGYDFLGQFVVDAEGNTRWIQTERLLEGANGFFASGVRAFETKVQTGEDLSPADAGWVAVDALVLVGAVKFLRMGRAAAQSTKSAGVAGRSAAYTSRLARAGRVGLTVGRYSKWPAAVALGYLVVTHPGIINDVLAGVAEVFGIPTWFAQVLGWTLLLLPLFYILSWIVGLLIHPTILLLRGLIRSLAWVDRRSVRL